MRILIVNSNTNEDMTRRLQETADRLAGPGTTVEAVHAPWGVGTVEGAYDAAFAALATAELVREHADRFDAFIIACYSDPGLFACRELTDKPVLGLAQSSMLASAALGSRFSILSPLRQMRPILENLVRLYGLERLCASVRTVDTDVLSAFSAGEEADRAFAREGRRALEEDGAEVLCLGGAIFAGRDHAISRLTGAPCIDGLSAAVKMAEMYVSLGYRTGKSGLFTPPLEKARRIGGGGGAQDV